MKNDLKSNKSYRDQLIDLAKFYNIVEVKSYRSSNKRLTTSQLELLLIKNKIRLPKNVSSVRALKKHEIRENSITNAYLSICFIFILAGMIVSRPYIKNIVNEVKFTYTASEFKNNTSQTPKKQKSKKKQKKIKKQELSDQTVSLNAETTMNLFEDLQYVLKDIRNGKKVKPIYLTKLPKDLKSLGDTSEKKKLFIRIVLPLILAENDRINKDREQLFKILNKNFNTVGERLWLKRRFKEYKIEDSDLSELKTRMDIIPVSIAIAQAAKESGWGTSRFALEGNALFGQWTWGDTGIKPLDNNSPEGVKVLNFQILRASVKAYKNNLNTHSGYKEFREARAKMRQADKKLEGLALIDFLDRYAATGKEYTKVLGVIIRQNSLTDFESSVLLPTRLAKGVSL
ncbi:MAG: hypothetical protein CBC24_05110 [Candidatus Pelagibacter sp. TMED64]|nr:glucosaminidase [Candidatus Pelagibacter sp.]OUU65505.1 MAG: hypothetical protein CBC24_05110 [Candidatus Pelagibacter sp. TMED64]